MAERVLSTKATLDATELERGLSALTDSVTRLGTKSVIPAEQGKAAWADFAKEVKEIDPVFGAVAQAAFELEKAINRVGSSGDNLGKLESNLQQANIRLEVLRNALQAIQASGGTVPQPLIDAFGKANDAVQKHTERLETLRLLNEKFGQSVSTVNKQFEQFGEVGKKAAEALERMEKAKDSPGALIKTSAAAELAFKELREEIDKVIKAGGTVDPALVASLGKVEDKIKSTRARAGELKDTMEDARDQANASAKGFEAMAGSAGSLEGMLGQLGGQGGATSKAIADVGFKAIALSAAFMGGYEAGLKLDAGLKSLGVDFTKIGTSAIESVVNFEKANRATNDYHNMLLNDLVPAIDNATGKMVTFAGVAANMIPESVVRNLRSWLNVTGLFAPEAELAHTKATAMGAAILAAGDKAAAAGIKLKAMGLDVTAAAGKIGDAEAAAKYFDDFLSAAAKRGIDDYQRALIESKDVILAWRDNWIDTGHKLEDMPAGMKKIIAAVEDVNKGINKQKDELADHNKVLETFGNKTEHEFLRAVEPVKAYTKEVTDGTGKARVEFSNLEKQVNSLKNAGKELNNEKGASLWITNVGKDADEARKRLEALDIKMTQMGPSQKNASQMDGTLHDNVEKINKEQKALGELMDLRTTAHELHMKQIDAEIAASRAKQEESFKENQKQQALIDAGNQLTQIEEGTIKFKGQLKIITMELAEATEAQTKALLDQVEAFKKVNLEMGRLDDYAANLLNAYQTGYTDLITTMNRVNETLTQLYKILGMNKGTEFEKTIQAWIDAFEQLSMVIRMGSAPKIGKMKIF